MVTRRQFIRGDWQGHAPLNIASLLLRARPRNLARLREDLRELPGVEVHAETPAGTLVVTAEQTLIQPLTDTIMQIHNLRGVVSATLVYHHDESSNPTEEAAS